MSKCAYLQLESDVGAILGGCGPYQLSTRNYGGKYYDDDEEDDDDEEEDDENDDDEVDDDEVDDDYECGWLWAQPTQHEKLPVSN